MSPNATQPEEEARPLVTSRLDALREGAGERGDCDHSPLQRPAWFDREKFDRAREIFKNHFFSIFFSHLAGLMLIVHLPSMTEPLMSTGNSTHVVALFRRYLSTLVHIRRWYEGDIFAPDDPAHQSICMVRGMHKRVADRLNNPSSTCRFDPSSTLGHQVAPMASNSNLPSTPDLDFKACGFSRSNSCSGAVETNSHGPTPSDKLHPNGLIRSNELGSNAPTTCSSLNGPTPYCSVTSNGSIPSHRRNSIGPTPSEKPSSNGPTMCNGSNQASSNGTIQPHKRSSNGPTMCNGSNQASSNGTIQPHKRSSNGPTMCNGSNQASSNGTIQPHKRSSNHPTPSCGFNGGGYSVRRPAVSQYDMALTQFAFVGLVAMFPRRVGIRCSREDLECLVHFWRCVGFQLGVEDKYNLCSGSLDETVALCHEIMESELKPSVLKATKESSLMSRGIIRAMNSFIVFLSWEAMARFWFEKMDLPCNFKMGPFESTGYWLMRFTFGGLLRFNAFHRFFNFLLRVAVKTALNSKEYYERLLVKRHNLANV